jgi:hypothetical protein
MLLSVNNEETHIFFTDGMINCCMQGMICRVIIFQKEAADAPVIDQDFFAVVHEIVYRSFEEQS